MIQDTVLLYFPDTKHFKDINIIFRDWLASLGNRVYDLSDSNYDEEIISVDEEGQNLEVIVDEVNEKLVSIKDLDSGHVITERQLDANGRFQVAGLRLRVNGSPKGKDSFTISDNLGGVGDGRNR